MPVATLEPVLSPPPAQQSTSWLTRWAVLRAHSWHGLLLAVLLFLAALGARFALVDALPPGFPFLTFFPAVVITTFLAGRRAGLLSMALCFLASWYWFIPPVRSFGLNGPTVWALGFFLAIAALDVWIIDAVIAKQQALEAEHRRIDGLLRQQRVLFHELQHRVANNMAMVGTVLAAQQRKLKHLPEAVAGFDEARLRFDTLARVHRRLHDPEMDGRAFETVLKELVRDVVDAAGLPIAAEVQVGPLALDLQARTAAALLVVELAHNAIKHAYGGIEGQARLEVSLGPMADGGYRLEVADNGVGLAPGVNPLVGERLGMRIVQGLAKSLRGSLRHEPRPRGTCWVVEVPGTAGGTAPPATMTA